MTCTFRQCYGLDAVNCSAGRVDVVICTAFISDTFSDADGVISFNNGDNRDVAAPGGHNY